MDVALTTRRTYSQAKGFAESRAEGEVRFMPWVREVHWEKCSVISRADHFNAFVMAFRIEDAVVAELWYNMRDICLSCR